MMNKSNSEHNNTSNTLSNIDKLKELRKIHINTIKKTQDQMKKNKEMKNSLYINYYKDKRNNQSPKPIKTKLSSKLYFNIDIRIKFLSKCNRKQLRYLL